MWKVNGNSGKGSVMTLGEFKTKKEAVNCCLENGAKKKPILKMGHEYTVFLREK